jgi:hypothetical protein
MIAMKEVVLGLVGGIVLIGFAGCGGPPPSGVIERQPPLSVGTFAPNIPFVSSNGKRTTLNRVRQPVAILAFVEMPGDSCCRVEPKLADLSAQFSGWPVMVVQISLPTGPCLHTGTRGRAGDLRKSDPVVLCDRDRVAWLIYGQPSSGTVIVTDQRSMIVLVSDMSHLRTVDRKAAALALEEIDLLHL